MITLYHCNTSLASFKVRIYLVEKQISFQEVHIDLRKQEHITSDYRRINPRGVVPSLKDDDGKIYVGSTEIIEHLENTFPKPALWPKDLQQRQLIHTICKEHEALHDPHLRTLSYYVVFMSPEKRKTLDVDRIVALAKNHPSPERGAFLARVVQGNFTDQEIKLAKQAVIDALDKMNILLMESQSGFLVEENYSFADAVCTASVFRIKEVGMENKINKHKLLAQWWQAMQVRPSFKTAILNYLTKL